MKDYGDYSFWNLFKRWWSWSSELLYVGMCAIASIIYVSLLISANPDVTFRYDVLSLITVLNTIIMYLLYLLVRVVLKSFLIGLTVVVIKYDDEDHKLKDLYNDWVEELKK